MTLFHIVVATIATISDCQGASRKKSYKTLSGFSDRADWQLSRLFRLDTEDL